MSDIRKVHPAMAGEKKKERWRTEGLLESVLGFCPHRGERRRVSNSPLFRGSKESLDLPDCHAEMSWCP